MALKKKNTVNRGKKTVRRKGTSKKGGKTIAAGPKRSLRTSTRRVRTRKRGITTATGLKRDPRNRRSQTYPGRLVSTKGGGRTQPSPSRK